MNPKELINDWDKLVHDLIAVYRVSKIIDGYPGGEGTYQLMGARVLKFANVRERRPSMSQ